jgi:hypothetical protein
MVQQNQTTPEFVGLNALEKVVLNPQLGGVFRESVADCGGSPPWQNRKKYEAHQIFALSQSAQRFTVMTMDLRESLRCMAFLRTPVPIEPDETGELRIAPYAIIGINYREQAVVEPSAGYAFVSILFPENVFHPNIANQAGGQACCFGSSLPAGIRAKELILLTYGTLAMQLMMTDPSDVSGVLNIDAARYFQVPKNLKKTPLTRESFLAGGDGYLAKAHEEKA